MGQCYTITGSSLNRGIIVEQFKKTGAVNPSLKDIGIGGADLSGSITALPGPWMYVRFKLSNLAFGFSTLPDLEVNQMGFIEGKKPSWIRFYNIPDKQEEVWRLGKGENLILIDKKGSIRVLGYGHNKLYEPTAEQVYTYFVKQEQQVADKKALAVIVDNQLALETAHPGLQSASAEYDEVRVWLLRRRWAKTFGSMAKKLLR